MRLFYILSLLLLLASCEKEKDAPTAPLMDEIDTHATQLYAGNFQNGPYGTVSGRGKILRTTSNNFLLVLDSFSTTNGPDLYVYLSKEIMPINFIEAGKLKSTTGRQVYTLPGTPDFSEYRYICIHCKQYNHLFGSVLLK